MRLHEDFLRYHHRLAKTKFRPTSRIPWLLLSRRAPPAPRDGRRALSRYLLCLFGAGRRRCLLLVKHDVAKRQGKGRCGRKRRRKKNGRPALRVGWRRGGHRAAGPARKLTARFATGCARHMDVPPNSVGSERAKEFVRLAEALLWPTVVEKARDGFFDGLLRKSGREKRGSKGNVVFHWLWEGRFLRALRLTAAPASR